MPTFLRTIGFFCWLPILLALYVVMTPPATAGIMDIFYFLGAAISAGIGTLLFGLAEVIDLLRGDDKSPKEYDGPQI